MVRMATGVIIMMAARNIIIIRNDSKDGGESYDKVHTVYKVESFLPRATRDKTENITKNIYRLHINVNISI